jgi:hypothetical protein
LESIDRFLRGYPPYELEFVLTVALVFVVALVAWFNIRRTPAPLIGPGVIAIGIAWALACTAQYWILGPFSAIGQADERFTSPWLYYFTRIHDGGMFAHAWSGGVDATANLSTATEYLSVDRLLFSFLPFWIALLIMKAGAIALAYAGGYRLARAFPLSREKAIVIGMFAGVGNIEVVGWVVSDIGWAIALLPAAFYVLVMRTDRPKYFRWVLLLALLYASSTSVIHTLPALYIALALGCVLVPPRNWARLIVGCTILGLVCLLNWSEYIYAFTQLGPEMVRANVRKEVIPLLSLVQVHTQGRGDFMIVPVVAVSLMLLALRRDPFVIRALPVYLVSFCLGTVVAQLDWQATGVSLLNAYRWELLSDGHILIGLLVTAGALRGLQWKRRKVLGVILPPPAAAYFATVAVMAAANHTWDDIYRYQSFGGQALLTQAECITGLHQESRGPFRVVSIPTSFAPNMLNSYGLEVFDGVSSAFGLRKTYYFAMAVTQSGEMTGSANFHLIRLPASSSLLADAVNLNALRLANVRFVVSDRRLDDPELKLSTVDCASHLLAGMGPPLETWLRQWAPKVAGAPHYIYELSAPWPRVFVPTDLWFSEAAVDDPAFYRELLSASAEPIAVVSKTDAGLVGDAKPVPVAYTLRGFRIVPNGFDIEVQAQKQASAPPGVVVVNVPYSRFWHASSDGRALPVVPVSGVQMAVILDHVSGPIELRYQRPTIATQLAGAWKAGLSFLGVPDNWRA